MSSKNYGLGGVGKDVQFGKQGKRVRSGDDALEMNEADGTTLARVKGANAVDDNEFVTLAQLETNSPDSGFWIEMGDPDDNDGDGDLGDGAIPINSTDSVSRTIDRLNETLGLLVPPAPPQFPSGNLSQSGYTAGNNAFLCDGTIPDNSGGTPPVTAAGSNVAAYRGTNANVSSNTIQDSGPGNLGTITAFINSVASGSLDFTDNIGDSINSNGLQISDNNHFPSDTPGFWQSFDARITGAGALTGWNGYSIEHSVSGSTNTLYVLRDSLTANPTVGNGVLSEESAGTLSSSSGVFHYGTNSVLSISDVTMNNIAGLTYRNSTPFDVLDAGTNNDALLSATKTYSYADVGITTPIAVNTLDDTPLNAISVTLDRNNSHGTGQLRYRGKNVNGNSNTVTFNTSILKKAGNTTRVDEGNISAPATCARVDLGVGDEPGGTPNVTFLESPSVWDSTQDLSEVGFLSEAAVVGGILSRNTTNYQTGFLPSTGQPDYTGKSDVQYFDFSFSQAALSGFVINITGNYSGLWVGLAGISDNASDSPNALGGSWWDAFELYNGAGMPGRDGDTNAGCANGSPANGGNGATSITFGTASSTNALGNRMYIRVALSSGQSISSISVS